MKLYTLRPDHSVQQVSSEDITAGKIVDAPQTVAKTHIGPILISTVFLGYDHRWSNLEGEAPILFETMIFTEVSGCTYFDGFQGRYCSWDDAVKGHKRAVALVKHTMEP